MLSGSLAELSDSIPWLPSLRYHMGLNYDWSYHSRQKSWTSNGHNPRKISLRLPLHIQRSSQFFRRSTMSQYISAGMSAWSICPIWSLHSGMGRVAGRGTVCAMPDLLVRKWFISPIFPGLRRRKRGHLNIGCWSDSEYRELSWSYGTGEIPWVQEACAWDAESAK